VLINWDDVCPNINLKKGCQAKICGFGNASVKERKGSGGSSGKTLKRNLYPFNCVGSLPKSTMQTAG
jgi:hypothetical protein